MPVNFTTCWRRLKLAVEILSAHAVILNMVEIAAAAASERVERTVAEQAVEPFGKFRLMAGEILTGCILEKRIVLVVPVVHAYPSRSFSASAASGVTTAVE